MGDYTGWQGAGFCSECGRGLGASDRFCPQCGTASEAGLPRVESIVVESTAVETPGTAIEPFAAATDQPPRASVPPGVGYGPVPRTAGVGAQAGVAGPEPFVPATSTHPPSLPAPGTTFCRGCGAETVSGGVICPGCGSSTAVARSRYDTFALTQQKSVGAAVLLSFFVPGLGQFYAGSAEKGIMFLVFNFINFVLMFILIGFFLHFMVWVWSMIDASATATSYNQRLLMLTS